MFDVSERKEILERKEMNEKLMRELEVKEQQTPKEVNSIQYFPAVHSGIFSSNLYNY